MIGFSFLSYGVQAADISIDYTRVRIEFSLDLLSPAIESDLSNCCSLHKILRKINRTCKILRRLQ